MEILDCLLNGGESAPLWILIVVGVICFVVTAALQLLSKPRHPLFDVVSYAFIVPLWLPIFYVAYMGGFTGSVLNGGAEAFVGVMVFVLNFFMTAMVVTALFLMVTNSAITGHFAEPPFGEPALKMKLYYISFFLFMQCMSSLVCFGNISLFIVSAGSVLLAIPSIFLKKKTITMHEYMLEQ